jgi:hypothetical protein
MSVSSILLTRRRSVDDLREVVARFIFRGLANGDDADVLTTLSVRNGHNLISSKPKVRNRRFPIILAGVFGGEGKPTEDLLSIAKVDAMLLQISLSFRYIPSEPA